MQKISKNSVLPFADFRYLLLDEKFNVAYSMKVVQSTGFQTIVVTRNNKPVGLVTVTNILDKVIGSDSDPDKVTLGEIMTEPLISVTSNHSTDEAMQLMGEHKIKRLPILKDGQVIGLVTQEALTSLICESVIKKSFNKYGKSFKERYKPIIGNLGLVLQFAGILLVVPAVLGAFMGETTSAAGLFLAVIGLFGVGFVLNIYGEKSELNIKQSSLVVVSSFLIMGLFGSLPYMYINPFSPNIARDALFVNSLYESISGFTTTGLSLISQPENLPQSFNFYRSYSQLVGGLSFIYIVMVLFYPQERLFALKSFLGRTQIPYKQLFIVVSIIFVAYSVILASFLYLIGEVNVLYDFAIIFSSITGGGFSVTSNYVSFEKIPNLVPVFIGMIISALPFAFHYSIFTKEKWKELFRTDFRKNIIARDVWKKILDREVAVYLLFMLTCIPIFGLLGGREVIESAFHVVSASTNSGFQLVGMDSIPLGAKIMLMFLMMVGGTAFSTAGGIKIGRFLLIYKKLAGIRISESASSISAYSLSDISSSQEKKNDIDITKEMIERSIQKYRIISKKALAVLFSDKVVVESVLVIFLFLAVGLVTGGILASINSGVPIENAIFESISALSTTGLSTGFVMADSNLATKLILIINMIAGRFEIIAILYIFIRPLRE